MNLPGNLKLFGKFFIYFREFMTLNEVPRNLMERVTDYIVSKWTNTKGVEQDKVLSICPKETYPKLLYIFYSLMMFNFIKIKEIPRFTIPSAIVNICQQKLNLM